MNKCFERLYNGIVKENPTLVLMLGMCPTLAVTTSAVNGLGMGLTTTAVLALSNVIISMLRKVIPNKIRIPAFIVIIASFVTIMQLILQAYIPSLYTSLGIYIPLIVVNCIILGRAEAYAYKNPVQLSFFDGLGMGLGFTLSLTMIGLLREFIGGCSVFGYELGWFTPVGIFKMAPGAFFVLALLTAIQNKVKIAGAAKGKDVSKIQSGCGNDCLHCTNEGCLDRIVEEPDTAAPQLTETEPATDEKVKDEKAKDDKIKDEKTKDEKITAENDKAEEAEEKNIVKADEDVFDDISFEKLVNDKDEDDIIELEDLELDMEEVKKTPTPKSGKKNKKKGRK